MGAKLFSNQNCVCSTLALFLCLKICIQQMVQHPYSNNFQCYLKFNWISSRNEAWNDLFFLRKTFLLLRNAKHNDSKLVKQQWTTTKKSIFPICFQVNFLVHVLFFCWIDFKHSFLFYFHVKKPKDCLKQANKIKYEKKLGASKVF